MDNNNLSRRDFLKKTGKAALAGSAALYFETLVGCATFPKETREDVDDIKWDCNPVLPMPKNGGIYIGTNKSGCLRNKQYHIASLFTEKYGKRPTFLAPGLGRRGSEDDGRIWRDDITEAHFGGAIPMIRYIVTPGGSWTGFSALKGYSVINRGNMDDAIKRYGAEAAKLEHPIIVCPFQLANHPNSKWRPWAGPDTAGPFKEAYVRIHDLWKQEGALEKVVMGVKLFVGRWARWQYPDPLRYIPPKDTVDIIGWATNNHCNFISESKSFEGILKTDYGRVVDKYPNKPQFIWEFSCNYACNQAAWLDDALTKIEEKYHWIKAVNLDECVDYLGKIRNDPAPYGESIQVVRKHFTKPRYIGSILPRKDI